MIPADVQRAIDQLRAPYRCEYGDSGDAHTDANVVIDYIDSIERVYTAADVERIIRRTWEVALRAGMQFVRECHMNGYNVDRFVEEILGHRSEET